MALAIYAAAIALAAAVALTSDGSVPPFFETQAYAGLAFVALYLTLAAGVLRARGVPSARRALGLSCAGFALLHAYFGFVRFVGGFEGLRYWSAYFARSLLCGLVALAILVGTAIGSSSTVARRMGQWWKPAQRLIYVAAVLVLVHAVTVTVHLAHLRAILVGAYAAVLPLVAVEVIRLDRWVAARSDRFPRNLLALLGVPVASATLFWAFFLLGHHEH